MTDQIELRENIEDAWSYETTFLRDEWLVTESFATGQCGVTALYVQEKLGGELFEGWIDNEKNRRHFFNVVNGMLIDLTWKQFPERTPLYHPKVITRSDILANDWFIERYQNFLNNVNNM